MGIDVTRGAAIIRRGEISGTSFGTSGRGRLKVFNRPDGDSGYALIETRHPAGEPRIRDHVHLAHEETFVVLEGRYRVRLGEDIAVVQAGDYVFIPRRTPHTYNNVGPLPAQLLNIVSPADGAELLVALGALADRDVDEESLTAVFSRHASFPTDPLPDW